MTYRKLRLKTANTFSLKSHLLITLVPEELINLAEQKNLQMMVDHTFLFTGAVRHRKKLLRKRNARKALLLRFDPSQPWAFSA